MGAALWSCIACHRAPDSSPPAPVDVSAERSSASASSTDWLFHLGAPTNPEGLSDARPIGAVWSADSGTVALASDEVVDVFNALTGVRRGRMALPCVTEVSLSPEGRWLAVGIATWSNCAFESYGQLNVIVWEVGSDPPIPREPGQGLPRLGPDDILALSKTSGDVVLYDLDGREEVARMGPMQPRFGEIDRRLLQDVGDYCEGWDMERNRFLIARHGHLIIAQRPKGRWQFVSMPLELPEDARAGVSRDHFFGKEGPVRCWVSAEGALMRATADSLWVIQDDGRIEWAKAEFGRRLGVIQDPEDPRWLQVHAGTPDTPPLRWRSVHGMAGVIVAFSPDAQRLVTYGTDRQAYLWDVPSLLGRLRSSAGGSG